MAIIYGTTGKDNPLWGTSGNDSIYGLAGDDRIITNDGDDYVEAGDGDDEVNSFKDLNGQYLFYPSTGKSTIYGNSGNDLLTGKSGKDTIYGGTGNDELHGNDDDDLLYGDEGNDTIASGAGNDQIFGGVGDDFVLTEGGSDTVTVGDGDDWVNSFFNKTVDWFYYTYSGGIKVNGGDGNDTLTGTTDDDRLFGESGNDNLTGLTGNDYLDGGTGNDKLSGWAGNDTLVGGEGDDELNGNEGNDSLDGGVGNDGLNGGDGNDQITGGVGNDVITTGDGTDTVYGDDGDDWVNSYFNKTTEWFYYQYTGSAVIFGGIGNDTLTGNTGDDKIYGESGNDRIDGLAGNDYIEGGTGNDKLSGWAGNDTLIGGEGDDDLNGNEGNDTLYGGEGNDILMAQSDGADSLYGGNGNDVLNAYTGTGNKLLDGEAGNDELYGGSNNDQLIGGYGDDKIYGYGGNDSLIGGEGNDVLSGNEGDDYLDGGSGVNFLNGGDGNDSYIISSRKSYINDSNGNDSAIVSVNFVKIPSSIENVSYVDGALKLPNWLDALLDTEFAGQQLTRMDAVKTFNFNFAQILPSYYGQNSQYSTGFKSFTKEQIAYTYIALSNLEKLIDVTFKQANTSSGLNNITFGNNSQTTTWGYAFGPYGTETGSDVFIAGDVTVLTNPTTYFDSFVGVLNHELGHALGLPHPSENKPTLIAGDASGLNTIMSYEGRPNSLVDFQALDIAALQYIYGPSTKVRSGNDAYNISESTTNMIWDGVGVDSINALSTSESVTIYLTPGYWGYVGNSQANYITAPGQITVNFGSIVENLIGSNFDDFLYGNEVGNQIEGGFGNDLIEGLDGDDTLLGGAGNDHLTGGLGNDSIDGGEGNDTLILNGLATNYTIRYESTSLRYSIEAKSGTEGKDSFKSIEFIKFSDKTIALQSIDLTPPTIAISSDLISLGIGKTATITFTLSEVSTTFTASDVTVSGGTLTNFTGSGSVYAATFTPTVNSISNGVVAIASGVFTDAAGNYNADGSDTNNKIALSIDTTPPTYSIVSAQKDVDEGSTASFKVTTTKIAAGTQINYSISGVSSQDITGSLLQGSVIVGANGESQILVKLLADSQTEGPESLTVTLEGLSASTLINDTSTYKGPAASDLVYVFKSEKVGAGVLPGSYSYYYTSNPEEAAYINAQAHWPWVQKASTFEAAHSMPSLSTPVFRFWSDTLQAPYFTISEAERDQIISWSSTRKNGYDWQYAGTGFSVYTSSEPTDSVGKNAIPVYCVWMDDTDFNPSNGLSGGLLFTADKIEYDGLVKLIGVTGAGVVFYGEVPGN
jgi:Ca2+-binding RTX toxin-like protein